MNIIFVLQNKLTINVIALAQTWVMVSFDCNAEEPAPVASKPIASALVSSSVQLKVPPHAATIVAAWTYTNRWDFPLYVERIDHSCSCLNSFEDTKEATSIAPGETGRIRANFLTGIYRGLLRKSIHVNFVVHSECVGLWQSSRFGMLLGFLSLICDRMWRIKHRKPETAQSITTVIFAS